MDDTPKIPAEQADALARRLQTSLKRRRPRVWIVVLVVLVAVAGLGLLAWSLYNPTALPRLEVIAFDAVAAPDETAQVRAQLAFPDNGEYAASVLASRDLVFLDASATILPGQQGLQKPAVSDAKGAARVEWPRPAAGNASIAVRYVDARFKQGSRDDATLFAWERGGKILLVDIDEALTDAEPAWETTPLDKISPRPHAAKALHDAAAKQWQIGYLAMTPARALTYRLARGWVRALRAEKERFPAGPVFGQLVYPPDADQGRATLLGDLKARFGDHITLIANRPETISAGRAAGVRVITVGAEAPEPGVANLTSWTELAGNLNP
jgi:hypothetical protein